nr:glomulin-like [Nomia melanderi]
MNSQSFIDELTDNLKKNKFEEALELFKDDSNNSIIDRDSWVIIQTVSSFITNENAEHNKELIDCCTLILTAIAEKCSLKQIIFEFLEEMEDDLRFCIVLKVIGKNLLKINDNIKPIKWCLYTIRSYVEDLSRQKETQKDTTNRILKIYNEIISFLELMVEKAALKNVNSEKHAVLRDHLLSLLIFLMGEPLCYLPDYTSGSQLNDRLPEKIIILMTHITGDLLWFLSIISRRSRENDLKKKKVDEESSNIKVALFESREYVPDLAYANLYFHVLTELHLWKKVPQIYNWEYIFQTCIYLIIKLLQETEIVAIKKGLNLTDHLLNKLTERSLTLDVLELNVYSKLFDALVKIMIYCDNDKERRKALEVFRKYIEIFDIEARYHVVLRLYQTSEHSGLLSLTTSIFKDSIIECLHTSPPTPYFLGDNFKILLKLACKLSHGSATDLVEISDEIITSLNLLRFLFLRDRYNQTGIWDLLDELKSDFLEPLREGIDLCRAHWKVRIKDLEEQKKTVKSDIGLEKSDAEVTLIVGGKKLPALPIPEKISFCHKAVNGLDVMESILIRINECIAEIAFTKNNDNTVMLK